MGGEILLLGIDGGGTQCRARLADLKGTILGEGVTGPANIRVGLRESLSAIREVTAHCLTQAGMARSNSRLVACLALAGASEPSSLAQARAQPYSFYRACFTTDAHAACVGAHAGGDGGVVIVGTGSIGWGSIAGRHVRIGGWGFPISDEGSGAWMGCESLRRVLCAGDGRMEWTPFLRAVFERFDSDPHAIVRWMYSARPGDYAGLGPLVVAHARNGDGGAHEIMRGAAGHVSAMLERLRELGIERLCLMGGLAEGVEHYLPDSARGRLSVPLGDALAGALFLAREHARQTAERSSDE